MNPVYQLRGRTEGDLDEDDKAVLALMKRTRDSFPKGCEQWIAADAYCSGYTDALLHMRPIIPTTIVELR